MLARTRGLHALRAPESCPRPGTWGTLCTHIGGAVQPKKRGGRAAPAHAVGARCYQGELLFVKWLCAWVGRLACAHLRVGWGPSELRRHTPWHRVDRQRAGGAGVRVNRLPARHMWQHANTPLPARASGRASERCHASQHRGAIRCYAGPSRTKTSACAQSRTRRAIAEAPALLVRRKGTAAFRCGTGVPEKTERGHIQS